VQYGSDDLCRFCREHGLEVSMSRRGNCWDAWTAKVQSRIPAGATTWTKVLVLASTIYQPGPWSDNRKFDYNFDDPFGKDVHTTMLSNYPSTRRGNCVSMPIFFAILA
jgi:serine protease inhibitor